MNGTLDIIAARRSHRAYKSTQLTQEQLSRILDAALQSPSAMNRQPWHFSVVQDQNLLNEISLASRTADEKKPVDQRSTRFNDPAFQIFYHAPTVIFLSAPDTNFYSPIDCGIAVQNIALAAESLGLGSVILGLPRDAFLGEHAQEFEKALCFPEGNHFVIAISLGIPDDTKPAHVLHDNKVSIIR